MKKEIKVEVSARHVHLTTRDLEKLFGEGYELTSEKELSQPGMFASTDTVTLVGPKNKIENVRVLGPCRNYTQIEVSKTDSYTLGATAPLRLSGKVIGSGEIKLIGAKGELELTDGLIVAKRHVHLSTEQANEYGLSNGQNVKVELEGPRNLIFNEVEVRVDDDFDEVVHLDTDEANAAGQDKELSGFLITE
jgi:putative phosphotransacetylase